MKAPRRPGIWFRAGALRRAGAAACCVAAACAAQRAPLPSKREPAPSTPAAPLPSTTESAGTAIPPALSASNGVESSPRSTVRFETLEPSTPSGDVPRIELVRPMSGEAIPPELARDYRVRARVTGQRVSREAEGVLVTLDGGRPRRLPDNAELKLSDLVPAGESVAPGRHVLLAVAVDAKGGILRAPPGERSAPLALVDFHVGEKLGELPASTEPRLFCLAPVGTFHGPEALRVRLELLAIGAAPEHTLVRVKAAGIDVEHALDIRKPHAVEGLPMGDVEFTAALPRGASARCIVTLNPGPKGERTP